MPTRLGKTNNPKGGVKDPEKALIPNPMYPGRNIQGHKIPLGPDYIRRSKHKLEELRQAISDYIAPRQVAEIIHELQKLCLPGDHGPAIQVQACALFLERVLQVGKPDKTTTTKAQKEIIPNYANMSFEDLKSIEIIMSKNEQEAITTNSSKP